MSFGESLRSLRTAAGLSQQELAERAGLTVNGVSALERGVRTHPYPHTLRALADALKLDDAARASFLTRAREPDARPPARPRRALLPAPPTPLIGRDADVGRLQELLVGGNARIVTLTGPGGVGKTRLAVEAARRAESAFPDGVMMVPLAELPDAGLVPAALLEHLGGVPASGSAPVGAQLVARLTARTMLLLLDNFEHVLDAAPLVGDLAGSCPGLTVLVTSRSRLRLRGETEFAVRPLTLPPTAQGPGDGMGESTAETLFIERARAVSPGFAVSADTAKDIATIVSELGGLPLAIECVAAKVSLFPPRQLLAHLDEAISTGWARDLPERQRSLRAVLDWSYRLLTEDERLAFRWLSVFSGGAPLGAAETVLAPAIGRGKAAALLGELTEHSLFSVGAGDDPVRYTMLQPVREYARALLREQGEEDAASRAHARCALRILEERAAAGDPRAPWDTANARSALDWCIGRGEGRLGAELAWAAWLPWLPWWMGDLLAEGRGRVEALLALPLDDLWRLRVLLVHGSQCYSQGDLAALDASAREALALARRQGSAVEESYAIVGMGMAAAVSDPSATAHLLREAVAIAARTGDPRLEFMAPVWSATAARAAGEPAAWALEKVLAAARRSGDRAQLISALLTLGESALHEAHPDDARLVLAEAIELLAAVGDTFHVAYALDLLAQAECAGHAWRRSAVLAGAAHALRTPSDAGAASSGPDAGANATRHATVAALGGDAYAEAFAEGGGLDLGAILDASPRTGVAGRIRTSASVAHA